MSSSKIKKTENSSDLKEGRRSSLEGLFNPAAVLAIALLWLGGGALVAYIWWNVSLVEKFFWAFGLWIWVMLSPLLFSFMIWMLSMICFMSGKMRLCQALSSLASSVYRICDVPLHWAGVPMPTIIYEMETTFLIGGAEFEKAERLALDVLNKREARFGKDNPAVCGILSVLGEVRRYQGRFGEAEQVLKRAVDLAITQPDFLDTAQMYYGLGTMYHAGFNFKHAEDSLLKAIRERKKTIAKIAEGQNKTESQVSEDEANEEGLGLFYSELGEIYSNTNKLEDAEKCFERAKIGHSKMITDIMSMCWYRKMGVLRIRQNRVEEAQILIEDAVRLTDKYCKDLPTERIDTIKAHALLEAAQNNYSASRQLLDKALTLSKKIYGDSHPATSEVLKQYSELLEKTGDTTKAADMATQAEAIKQKVLSEFAST